MNTKINSGLYQVVNAVILSGIILMFLGTYYCVIKAGIPYQDPPLELQIQYIVNMKIGETLLKNTAEKRFADDTVQWQCSFGSGVEDEKCGM